MEPLLERLDLDFYVTWSCDRLPAYGDGVVAIVLGDEVGRIPRYVDRVRAVFKCYGIRPTRGAGALRNPSVTGLASTAQYAVRCLRWLPSAAAYARMRAPAPITTIPIGTFNQLEVPLVPILERPTDLFFAGSVEHDLSLHHRLLSPKTYSRREMLDAVECFARSRPDLRTDLRITPSFGASVAAPGDDYSHALMASKVCLTPRGTSLETFRVLEGLRAGCVVIGDLLPDHAFYAGAPLLQLARWSELESALGPLLERPEALQRQHLAAREWWRDHCSEAAVGRQLADRLNALRRLNSRNSQFPAKVGIRLRRGRFENCESCSLITRAHGAAARSRSCGSSRDCVRHTKWRSHAQTTAPCATLSSRPGSSGCGFRTST